MTKNQEWILNEAISLLNADDWLNAEDKDLVVSAQEIVNVFTRLRKHDEQAEAVSANLAALERLEPGDALILGDGIEYVANSRPKPDLGGRIFTSGDSFFFLPQEVVREMVRGGAKIVKRAERAQGGDGDA